MTTRVELVEACLAAAGAGMELAWASGARDEDVALIPPVLSICEGDQAWAHAMLLPALTPGSLPAALVLPTLTVAASGCASGLVFTADTITDTEGRVDLDRPSVRWARGERDGLVSKLVAYGSWGDGGAIVVARSFATGEAFEWTSDPERWEPFAGPVHEVLVTAWRESRLVRSAKRAARARQGAEWDVKHRRALAETLVGMGCPVLLAADIRRHLAARASTN